MLQEDSGQSLKDQANALYKQGDYHGAIDLYSNAIELEPSNPTFYSNRSAAYMMLYKFVQSLQDCRKALELDNKMTKVYVRASKCCLALGSLEEAK